MTQTVWTILPPLISIVLALLTKEVYSSLVVGVFCGAMLFTNFNVLNAIVTMFEVMGKKIGDNAFILIFLVILGIMVAVITRSGAVRAYGEWATKSIHSQRSALLATALLGVVIFIDDYFNCLTVGTVMRPVTDKLKVARTKLAYIIDATAAPICIIAPVSSWAAAVGSSLPKDSGIDGFTLFLQTIPFNLYALLTMAFMLFIACTRRDFGPMATSIRKNDVEFEIPKEYRESSSADIGDSGNGRIIDLILPLVVLIASCVFGMLYTGGIFDGKGVADSFANCDSAKSLVIGSFIALIYTAFQYLPRKVITYAEFCDCFAQGFKAMTPAIFILCLAWSLSGICSDKYLNLGGYVGALVSANAMVITFLPIIFFLVGAALAFAIGTSWGTFGILIPIAVAVVGMADQTMLVLCVTAILSGAVCGDHASPISDTTILASAGAQCSHLDHVSTQIPYVILVATCSALGYIVDGLTRNGWLGVATGFGCLAIVAAYLYIKREAVPEER